MTQEEFDALPEAQREGVEGVFERLTPGRPWGEWLAECQPELCGWGAIMCPAHGVWIGVEQDGHAHS